MEICYHFSELVRIQYTLIEKNRYSDSKATSLLSYKEDCISKGIGNRHNLKPIICKGRGVEIIPLCSIRNFSIEK